MISRFRRSWMLVLAILAVSSFAQAQSDSKGVRVYSVGHSFHYFMPPILTDIAKKAGLSEHKQVGLSAIGGSRVIQHWNKIDKKDTPAEMNQTRELLKAGKIDVFTMSPIHLPDDGIENFVKLAIENNPKIRVLVQEFWLPFDIYDTTFSKRPKDVDHDKPTIEELRKSHEPYFKGMDEHVVSLNKKYKTSAVYVVPVGQAVLSLRDRIVSKKAPGLTKQSDLFTDAIGHAKAPLRVLVAYCYYAAIYQKSPVGLPVPGDLGDAKSATTQELNRVLQEIAWDAVTSHPLSGVTAEKK